MPRERSHYFYFVLSDCSLEFYDAHPPLLDYRLHLTNGASELPADEGGLIAAHGFATVGLLAACAVCVMGLLQQLKRYGQVSSFPFDLHNNNNNNKM
jgi:hypothetical protein